MIKNGLSKKRIKTISESLPKQIHIDHSFHVLIVKFITEKVEKTIENFSKCLIMPARVIKVNEKISVEAVELQNMEGKLIEKKKIVENPFKIHLKKNELVSIHWNNIIEKISKKTVSKLIKSVMEKFS